MPFLRRLVTASVDQPYMEDQSLSSLDGLVERLREVVQDIGAAKVCT